MALTATELTKLRHLTGGVTEGNEPDHLTDTELQAEYTAVADSFDSTILPVLRLRVGMAAVYVNGSPEFGIEQYEARWTHLRRLLDYYEQKFGESGTLLQSGTLELGLDRESSDPDWIDAW